MDFGIYLTCLFFGTLLGNVAMEKKMISQINLDRLLPLISKPALITGNKVVNKDKSIKTETILPTAGDNIPEPGKTTILDKSKQKETPEQENKKAKVVYFENVPACPACVNEDASDTKEHGHNSKTEAYSEQKPIQDKNYKVRKTIKMKIEKPYIIHINLDPKIYKTNPNESAKPEIAIQNNKLGAEVNPNRNIERKNDNEVMNKASNGISITAQNALNVKTASVLGNPWPNHNLVKIENDYHMKEYKELYAPYFHYTCPYIQNYSYKPNGYNPSCYSYNQNNGYSYNQNNGYSYNQIHGYSYKQNKGYNYNRENGYSNIQYNQNSFRHQKPISKVWRTISYTTRKNDDIVSQKVFVYSPVFDNNCYSTGLDQIGGYAFYFNHNNY